MSTISTLSTSGGDSVCAEKTMVISFGHLPVPDIHLVENKTSEEKQEPHPGRGLSERPPEVIPCRATRRVPRSLFVPVSQEINLPEDRVLSEIAMDIGIGDVPFYLGASVPYTGLLPYLVHAFRMKGMKPCVLRGDTRIYCPGQILGCNFSALNSLNQKVSRRQVRHLSLEDNEKMEREKVEREKMEREEVEREKEVEGEKEEKEKVASLQRTGSGRGTDIEGSMHEELGVDDAKVAVVAVVISDGMFHPLGAALTLSCSRVLWLNPHTWKIKDITDEKEKFLRKRFARIESCRSYQTCGILFSGAPGQSRMPLVRAMYKMAYMHSYTPMIFSGNLFDLSYLQYLPVEFLVSTACPRIAIDDADRIKKPVLTPPEFEILCGLRKWEDYVLDQFHGESGVENTGPDS